MVFFIMAFCVRPAQVYATATSFLTQLNEAGVKDSAHCLITFPSGAVFTLEMTRCSAYGYDNRIEVGDGYSSNCTTEYIPLFAPG